jgi:ribosome-associated protein
LGDPMVDRALAVARAAEDKRAVDTVVLDLRGLTVMCDFFVICHGQSRVHVQAIAEGVREQLKEQKVKVLHREGFRDATWIILDLGDVIVHIFSEEGRQFYDLETLWGEAPVIYRAA